MGVVYEARVKGAHGFERKVAFKTLLLGKEGEQPLDPTERTRMVRRFFDEARIVSRLHHGGIVSVLDYGIRNDEPFQVLELIDGLSVATLLRERSAFPADIALHIALEVAHALSYAHRATDDEGRPLGITHRDVKPSNVLIARTGDVKLVDFGIARADDRSVRTTTGVVAGTPTYMAPEQLAGLPVDGRTDVFALGCTLHAMLTGRSPLAGVAPADLFGPTEVKIHSESVPADIGEVIRRAIRKAPNDRFATADEMAQALSALVVKRLQTDARSRLASWLSDPKSSSAEATAAATATKTDVAPAPAVAAVESPPDRVRIFVVAMSIVLGVGAIAIFFGIVKLTRTNNVVTPRPIPSPTPTPAPTPTLSTVASAVVNEENVVDAATPTVSSSSAAKHGSGFPHPSKAAAYVFPSRRRRPRRSVIPSFRSSRLVAAMVVAR